METRTCQNCKGEFVIDQEDFGFYKKIKVPPPTWCPECRFQRRLVWRNDRIWYKRKCDATGESVLSIFASDKPYKVYEQTYWKSDAWDPLDYGVEYDFNKSFFEQFDQLLKNVPHPNLVQKNNTKSDYSNYALNSKNGYQIASVDDTENCAYLFGSILHAKESYDLHLSTNIEFCYELVDCDRCNRLFFSEQCVGCFESFFLYDCRNCSNCFGCVGFRNKHYCVFNIQYSKEDYFDKVNTLLGGSYKNLIQSLTEFNLLKQKIPRKYANIVNSHDVSGDDIINCRNVHDSFNAHDVENCKYSFRAHSGSREGYDSFIIWNGGELFVEAVSAYGQNIKFSAFIWGGFDVEYSYNCFDCNNIFGCIGLRNKSYCIFNKQFQEKEFKELLPKIRKQMEKVLYRDRVGNLYSYGEFFPPQISPFDYNETLAQEYFSKDPETISDSAFSWRKPFTRNYNISLNTNNLPDNISDVPDSITNEVIECSHRGECKDECATAFKIISSELAFLRKFGLPLPRLCPACRHMERVRQKTPLELFHRKCTCDKTTHNHKGNCEVEFETSYAPERPEIIYCEKCYQQEVY